MKLKRPVLMVMLLALLVGGGAYVLWRKPAPSTAPQRAAHPADRLHLAEDAPQRAFLKVEAAGEAPLPAAGPFNGRLTYADDETARIYPPVNGRLLRSAVNLGDVVKPGQVLGLLDAPDFGAAVADARKAQADATLKSRALVRAQTLYGGEAIARRDLEAAEAEAVAAQAEAERARLRLANLAPEGSVIQGEQLMLRSPLAGIVTERQVNPGTEVRADGNTPLYVISNLRRLWLSVDLPERETAVQVGDRVQFTVDAWPERRFEATVDRIAPVLDPATRRIALRAVVDNDKGELRPEMYARARFAKPDAVRAVRVPLTAALTQGLTTTIFVEESPGEFVRRRVNVLRQDSEFLYLAPQGGLAVGERLVTKGAMLLASELAGVD